MEKEYRQIEIQDVEIRESKSGIGTLTGYAIVFGKRSLKLGDFYEFINERAFDRALAQEDEVLALAHHNMDNVLGRRSAGTLRLNKDGHGISVEVDLPDTSYGRDILENVKRRDVKGMSFGFSVREDDWDLESDVPTRTVNDADLFEVSFVAVPAYPDTTAAMRSLNQAIEASEPTLEPEHRNVNESRLRLLKIKPLLEDENKNK